jgi:hypothetical protein
MGEVDKNGGSKHVQGDNFYCNCTFGNRCSVWARYDYKVLPNDGAGLRWVDTDCT